jgi:hypothetical protein
VQRDFPFFVFRPGMPAASFAAGSVCIETRLTKVSRPRALSLRARTPFQDNDPHSGPHKAYFPSVTVQELIDYDLPDLLGGCGRELKTKPPLAERRLQTPYKENASWFEVRGRHAGSPRVLVLRV